MSRLQICEDCKAYLQFCVCADREAMERRHAGQQTEDDEEINGTGEEAPGEWQCSHGVTNRADEPRCWHCGEEKHYLPFS